MKKQNKTDKKSFIKTKVKANNAVEVEIQKNPANTIVGKIFLFILIGGMTVLGLVSLIMLMVQVFGKL